MSGVAPGGPRAYLAGMRATFLTRLITALALMLMPLGMATAGAAMAHAPAPAASGHCEDAPAAPEDEAPGRSADCTMACSALPAGDVLRAVDAPAPEALAGPVLAAAVAGLHPEAAVPPPRLS